MSDLERIEPTGGVHVDPEAIEDQLAALWREAGESVEGHQAVTRACLWNVIAVVEGDEDPLLDAVKRLPAHLASRTLVVRVEAEGAPPLEAGVSANCILAEGGGKLVCSEEVTLVARGDGQEHLPSLLRALLVPGVPTAAVFSGVPDPDSRLHHALIDLSDRVVTDADRATRGAPLEIVHTNLRSTRLHGMDLGWLRRASVRENVAGMFDPPATEADVAAVRRVTVDAPEGEAWSARLVLGWVAEALGLGELARTDGGWRAAHGDAEVELALRFRGRAMAVKLESDASHAPRKVACDGRARVSDGCSQDLDRPEAEFPLEAQIARALVTRAEDDPFRAALDRARRLDP